MSDLLVDLGGTSLRGATRVDGALRVRRVPAPGFVQHPALDGPALVEALLAALVELAAALGVPAPDRLGLGFPGPTDPAGRAWKAPTLWGDRVGGPVDLPALLRQAWPQAALHVVNDVTGAGYRYLRDRRDSLCVVTVSSGVGHKVFIDGQPAVGAHGRGGELGHLRMDWSSDAPRCDCGGVGHLGALSSGRAVPWQARQEPNPPPWAQGEVTAEDLAAHYPHDPWALRVADRLAAPLGRALAAVHIDVGIERFVIMGGLGVALGPAWAGQVAAHAAAACWDTGQDWREGVETGEEDDDSVLLGLENMLRLRGAA
ncbi:MAG: ROK family protein [Alphaproteobacteria bacterium]|nr:ROK family protein [Alphaproteobacteria bacterium]